LLFLSAADVETVGLKPDESTALVRCALLEHAEGAVEMPPKTGVHPPRGRHVHAMPAFLSRSGTLGMKWIADFPGNPSIGLPTLSAVIVLNDSQTGVPVCIMDGGTVTAARTAAMTAVSLLACARAGPVVAAIIGTGAQARAHARMLAAVLSDLRGSRLSCWTMAAKRPTSCRLSTALWWMTGALFKVKKCDNAFQQGFLGWIARLARF